MNRDQLEKLWETRFHKILDLEEDSLSFYRDLSERNDLIAENPRLKEMMDEILEDEQRHSVICKELVRVVTAKNQKKESL